MKNGFQRYGLFKKKKEIQNPELNELKRMKKIFRRFGWIKTKNDTPQM